MSTTAEEVTTLTNRQDTFLERANRIPQMLDEWEASVMNRLDQAKDIEPVNKSFAMMNFHKNELAILGLYQTKASVRLMGVVGRNQAFEVGGANGMNVSFKPEVEMTPEKMALDNLNKEAEAKSEVFQDEFDDFIVIYLDQVGKSLKPPINLAEMAIKQALDRMDARVNQDQLVDIRNVTRNLELPEDQQNRGYPLNPKEKEVYDLLLPLTLHEQTAYKSAGEATRFPYSVASALRYVWNKSAYYFLSDITTLDSDEEPPKEKLKAPNALEVSISQIYMDSELVVGSVHRRDFPSENVEWYLNSLKSDVSNAPASFNTYYQEEHFKSGELVKLYNYPALDTFL